MDVLKISYTQISTYLQCPAKWWFRYVVGLKVPPLAAQVWGRAIDRALSHNYSVKVRTGSDEHEDVLEDMFVETYREEAREAVFFEDDSREKDENVGRLRVVEYRRKVAPRVVPVAVQKEYTRQFGDIQVTGILDVEGENEVIDIKTGSRVQSSVTGGQMLQLEVYSALREKPAVHGHIHLITRTSGEQGVYVLSARLENNRKLVDSVLSGVVRGIQNEVVYPNREHVLCSRRWCGFWEICEKTFGGMVRP